jgi:hypothetical protein
MEESDQLSERDRRLFGPGPKRILSLDGGGVRGIVSLAFLEQIEKLLSDRARRPVLLADYFDLIGGTSTGAIIATGLSLGKTTAELIDAYVKLSQSGFRGVRFHGGLFVPKFRSRPLLREIERHVGEETLGSTKLRTGLAIIAKRIDTGSPWVLHNNPRGKYYDPVNRDAEATPNRSWPLAQLLRASTAAPTFFAPLRLEIAQGIVGDFVDGGVSPYNNPALLLLMLATLKGYGFCWPLGADRLSVVSIGTGHWPLTPSRMPGRFAPTASLAVLALRSVIDDCGWLTQAMLQWLGASPTAKIIDSEIGDLSGDQLGAEPALNYVRYDIELTRGWLEKELSIKLSDKDVRALEKMDRPKIVPRLLELSREAALKQVSLKHLEAIEEKNRT